MSLPCKGAPTASPYKCKNISSLNPATCIQVSPANGSKESLIAKTPDESSHLWPPRSAPLVNEGRPTSLADTHQSDSIERREASDISYIYRPTPIDLDSQQQNFLSSPLPFNNTSPVVLNRTTDNHQGLASIGEDNIPYDPSGKFILNPKAPVFVPRQGSQPGMLLQSWSAV